MPQSVRGAAVAPLIVHDKNRRCIGKPQSKRAKTSEKDEGATGVPCTSALCDGSSCSCFPMLLVRRGGDSTSTIASLVM